MPKHDQTAEQIEAETDALLLEETKALIRDLRATARNQLRIMNYELRSFIIRNSEWSYRIIICIAKQLCYKGLTENMLRTEKI